MQNDDRTVTHTGKMDQGTATDREQTPLTCQDMFTFPAATDSSFAATAAAQVECAVSH